MIGVVLSMLAGGALALAACGIAALAGADHQNVVALGVYAGSIWPGGAALGWLAASVVCR